MDSTGFYNEHAARFIAETEALDMTELYQPFCERCPPPGRLLDIGCGSGRDALHFKSLGYEIRASDPAASMAAHAAAQIQQAVDPYDLQTMPYQDEFDGIWACAAMLHVPRDELPIAFSRCWQALKPGGLLYVSFKEGATDRHDQLRAFTNFDRARLTAFVRDHTRFRLDQLWRSADGRPDRPGAYWINALLRKPGLRHSR